MKMMELEVDINFTSLFIVDETFCKRTVVVTCRIHIYQLFVSRRKIFSKGKKFIFWSCPISNKKFIILVH
jgi:hypothetical protein